MYTCYRDIGAAGGWITVIQWLVWIIQLLRKAWRVFRGKGINQAHFDPEGRKAEALAELMGPGAVIPEVKRKNRWCGILEGMMTILMVLNMCRKRNRDGLHIFRWACRDVQRVNKVVNGSKTRL